jgi:hypothetical protein
MEERIQAAVEAAQYSYWAVIASRFPEVKTGDMDPMDQFNFSEACECAVRAWLAANLAVKS